MRMLPLAATDGAVLPDGLWVMVPGIIAERARRRRSASVTAPAQRVALAGPSPNVFYLVDGQPDATVRYHNCRVRNSVSFCVIALRLGIVPGVMQGM